MKKMKVKNLLNILKMLLMFNFSIIIINNKNIILLL